MTYVYYEDDRRPEVGELVVATPELATDERSGGLIAAGTLGRVEASYLAPNETTPLDHDAAAVLDLYGDYPEWLARVVWLGDDYPDAPTLVGPTELAEYVALGVNDAGELIDLAARVYRSDDEADAARLDAAGDDALSAALAGADDAYAAIAGCDPDDDDDGPLAYLDRATEALTAALGRVRAAARAKAADDA